MSSNNKIDLTITNISPKNIQNKEFLNNIENNVVCKLCSFVLIDPKQCSNCKNLYCSICIEVWLKNNKNCPFNCCFYEIQNASNKINNILEDLKIKCDYCYIIFDYKNYISHTNTCSEKILVTCPICNNKNSCKIEDISNYEYKLKNKMQLTMDFLKSKSNDLKVILDNNSNVEYIKLFLPNNNKYDFENKILKEQIKSLEKTVNILQQNYFENKLLNKTIKESNIKLDNLIINSELKKDNNYLNYKYQTNINLGTASQLISYKSSMFYMLNNEILGSGNIDDLIDLDCKGGICINENGYIIFEIRNILNIKSLKIGGYKGNLKSADLVNGIGSKIYISKDNSNWIYAGEILTNLKNSLSEINLIPTLGKFIKINSISFLGIGFFQVNSDENKIKNEYNNRIYDNSHKHILTYKNNSGFYYYDNNLIGSDNINCLSYDLPTNNDGLCINIPCNITFELIKETYIYKISLKGYNGNKLIWNPNNGQGAIIKVSKDNSTFYNFGKIPNDFGNSVKSVINQNLDEKYKYINVSHNSYVGISYLSILDKNPDYIYNEDNNCIYKFIIINKKYISNNHTAGTQKVEHLLDNNPSTGICSDLPGEIIIILNKKTSFDTIDVCGWNGNKEIWATSNGSKGNIEISYDGIVFNKIGELPELSDSIETIKLQSKVVNANKIKLTSNNYLGLGNFRIFDSIVEDINSIRIFPTNYFVSLIFSKTFYIKSINDLKDINNNSTGICISNNNYIIFDFEEIHSFKKIEVRGFNGNKSKWHPTQGIGSEIFSSENKLNWNNIGSIPKGYGINSIKINLILTKARYIKINCNKGKYFGLSYICIIK